MTKAEFGSIMWPIVRMLPDSEVPWREVADVYYRLLADLPQDALATAVVRFLSETSAGRWLPPIGKLRELADAAIHGEAPGWGEAWDTVLRAAKHHSLYDARRRQEAWNMLDAATCASVKALGGLAAIGDTPPDSLGTLRAQFRSSYQEHVERETRHRRLPEPLRPRVAGTPQKALPAVKLLAERIGA